MKLNDKTEDDVMAIAMEQGAEDVEFYDDEAKIICAPDEDVVWNIQEALESSGVEVQEANVVKLPQTMTSLDQEQQKDFETALEALYEAEPDIQNMYHNAEYDD